jgi:hypothetical protein
LIFNAPQLCCGVIYLVYVVNMFFFKVKVRALHEFPLVDGVIVRFNDYHHRHAGGNRDREKG